MYPRVPHSFNFDFDYFRRASLIHLARLFRVCFFGGRPVLISLLHSRF